MRVMTTRRRLAFLAPLILGALASAGVPTPDQLTKDLSGPFATKVPNPDLSRRGPSQAAKFSWDATAKQTLTAYRRVQSAK